MYIMNNDLLNKCNNYENILNEIAPVKITESQSLKLHSMGWSIITEYYLESVKSYCYKGKFSSSAVIRIGDKSGQVTCVIKGTMIGLLFGLTKEQWGELEKLTRNGGELFYRYFKDGLNENFRIEQKLFYYFCKMNQRSDVLVAVFRRNVNNRPFDKNEPLLEVLELRKCNDALIDIYQEYLRKESAIERENDSGDG